MSSIPQGAFAAYKLRAKSTKVAVSRIQTSEDKQPSYYSKKCNLKKSHLYTCKC